jgi:thiol-disulfide isomerase/thioredoxin
MKIFYLLILIFISLNCFAQKNFTIEAKNLIQFNNAKVYFYLEDNDPRVYSEKPDSTIIKNGEFQFRGIINQPSQKVKIIIKAKSVFTTLLAIDTGFNNVNFQEVETVNFPKYYIASVVNSKASRIKQQIDSIHNKNVNAYRKDVKKPTGPISLPIRVQQKDFKEQISVIKNNPNDFYALIVLNEISKYASMIDQQELILSAFDSFSKNLKNSALGSDLFKIVSESLNAKNGSKAGQMVPVFKVKTIDNQLFENNSLRGSPYLIAFSATWCLPCLEMQPELLAMYNKYKSQGFKVVYFNIDDNVSKWKEHVSKRNLTWINVSEQTKPLESKICKQFNVAALPTYFLVNSDGVIEYNSDEANDNYKNLESRVKKLLNAKN